MRSNFFSSSSTPNSVESKAINTFSYSIMVENIEKAGLVINKWDLEEESSSSCRINYLLFGDRTEAREFLNSVSDLNSAMQFISSKDSNSDILVQAQNLMEIAMKRLQKEFQQILSTNRAYLDTDSVSSTLFSLESVRSSTSDFDDVSEDESPIVVNSVSQVEKAREIALADLKSIAGVMISTGHGKECMRIYKEIRKSMVDESLYLVGLEKLSSLKLQKMDWESIETKIKLWVRVVKTAVTSLFTEEKIMCEHVFSASPIIAESCFTEIISDGASNLFKFPENVAKYKKLTLEKLFRILDLYEALSELWPEIESIFSYESLTHIRSQAIDSLFRLSEATRYMLTNFEAAIQKDDSKSVPGGGVHPLTRYVMNYIILLSDYSGILCDILADSPLSVQSPMPKSYFHSPVAGDDLASVVSAKFAWIILILLCKLDVKALYNDVALSYLFLANNLNYVVSKVRNSNLKILLGDEWLVNHENKVKHYAGNYERVGWSKVISTLVNPMSEISEEELRESIAKFSTAFEEAYKKQKFWVVPEQKLRDGIKISLAKKLGSAYRRVYEEYKLKKNGEVWIECLVRYAPDNLGNYLSDLF